MDPTGPADQVNPAMEEAIVSEVSLVRVYPAMEEAIVSEISLLVMETNNHDNSPLLTTGDTCEETRDQASSIVKALHLMQVIYLVFAGIIASLLAIYSIISFAVLVVACIGYFGLFWYNVASSGRTRENAIALAIRSFSVAAVLATSAQPVSYNWLPSEEDMQQVQRVINVLLLLVVSVLDWRWNGLFS